jgi:hypothetical protein
MSAYICTDRHFATVAQYMFPDNPLNAQSFADSLKRENIKSVNYRYCEKTRFKRVDMSQAMPVEQFTKHDILKLMQGIDYQSCEHPDYVCFALSLAIRALGSEGADSESGKFWSI